MRWAAGSDTEGSEELASLQAGFPQFRIWREVICNRARYNARRLHRGTHPHTVVTTDPDELRAALSGELARLGQDSADSD
jgi:hypothetical protein